MSRWADLHLHTRYSDGTFTPDELVKHAAAAGLGCISLTDHDTVSGLAETAQLCSSRGIEFISGVELTAHLHEREVHVLGYGFRADDANLLGQLQLFQQVRARRVVEMLAKLQSVGVELKMENVTAVADGASALGRLHVARALLNGGFTRHIDEAFQKFIGKGKPAFVPKFRLAVDEAARLLHAAGGVAILAHPGISNLDDQLGALIDTGLDGIEVWHSRHSNTQSERFLAFTRERGCLATGGSDCHGLAKDHILIGGVRLPYSYIERLKEYHARTLPKVS